MKSKPNNETANFLDKEFEKAVKIASDYFNNINEYDVLPKISPGMVKNALPHSIPEAGENFDSILEDMKEIIIPNLTHWNHPGFMAYFNSSSSGPGIIGEFLSAVFNTNHMVWKSSPASAELEEVTLGWFRELIGFDNSFYPIIYDTASVSTMHALAAARENLNLDIRKEGIFGRQDLPAIALYCTEHTHSSIEKAAIHLGVGLKHIRKIECDENYSMNPKKLEEAINNDIAENIIPFAVVATIGTTSLTSIDPVNKIADICNFYNVWLHVDAAYAGVTAMLPEFRKYFAGIEKASSIVVNPHKWMFTPIDISVLFIKDRDTLKNAFSLVPEYLKTSEDDTAINLMDYGIQLGRRFRALKFWFVMRYYGKSGLQKIISDHVKIAKTFAKGIASNSNLELFYDVNFATVCWRAIPQNCEDVNVFNKNLMEKINSTGKFFFSHTVINGVYVIRTVFSSYYHTKEEATKALEIVKKSYSELINS